MTDAEAQLRRDLAACYRLIHHYGWSDLTYTHITARLPGTDTFLINAYGLLFDEITASNLVTVAHDGTVVDDPTGIGINRPGYVIHSAIHAARPDIACVVHTHTAAGLAVAAQEDGLLPITQHAMKFWGAIGYHDYEGISMDEGERERLAANLGPHNAMVLRNHGLIACGPTVAHAFHNIYFLERACAAQVRALAGGVALRRADPASVEKTAAIFADADVVIERDWRAMIRLVDRVQPDYAA